MIITISGMPGSGKSTVAKLIASKLGMKYYSVGDFMREIAVQRNMSLIDLSKLAETDRRIDEQLDDRQIRMRTEDNFVIDSRLGFHFMPNSTKIFLKVDIKNEAKRIFSQKRKEEHADTLEEIESMIKRRIQSEKLRYNQYYNIDIYDMANYDLVIDTSNISAEQVADKIVKKIRK
jgi:cytidylate kinase